MNLLRIITWEYLNKNDFPVIAYLLFGHWEYDWAKNPNCSDLYSEMHVADSKPNGCKNIAHVSDRFGLSTPYIVSGLHDEPNPYAAGD